MIPQVDEAPSGRAALTFNNRDLDPEENESYEAGFKLDLFGSQAMLTGDDFPMDQMLGSPTARSADPGSRLGGSRGVSSPEARRLPRA